MPVVSFIKTKLMGNSGLTESKGYRIDVAHEEFMERAKKDFKKVHGEEIDNSGIVRIALDLYFSAWYPAKK